MGDLPEEAQQCVDENLSDEVLHDFLVSIFMNDQEGGQQDLIGGAAGVPHRGPAEHRLLGVAARRARGSAMWAAGGTGSPPEGALC